MYGETYKIYVDHKNLKYLFSKKEFNIRQKRWIDFLNDYDCSILYHHGKANVVVDVLSRKSSGSLAVLQGRQPHLFYDLETLGAQFTILDSEVQLG